MKMVDSVDHKDYEHKTYEKPNLKGDRLNILLLVSLYTLLHMVYGITQVIPLVMQNRKVSYIDQAGFSITAYPGCLKLLWAPIVDCVYSKKIGRRKSWLIPAQYFIGATLLFVSVNLDDLLGSEDGLKKPKIHLLTAVFFVLMFFSTLQEVSLDGWTITLLQRRNIGYAGTCQNIGYTIGNFTSVVVPIVLDSKDFCNMFRSVPQNYGFVNLSSFIFFWSILMMTVATTILIFKRDNSLDNVEDDFESKLRFTDSYKHLWAILKVRPIQILCVLLLTHEIVCGPYNGAVNLKLIDAGVSREKLVLMDIPSVPIKLILSVVFANYLTGPRAIRSFSTFFVLKLTIGIAFAIILLLGLYLKDNGDHTHAMLPMWYYILLVFVFTGKNVILCLMGTAMGAFYIRISDPRFGGIYMSLIYTAYNMGSHWPITLSLWSVNYLSIRTCSEDKIKMTTECETIVDGYAVVTLLCTVIGIVWLIFWARKVIKKLDRLDSSDWIVTELKPASLCSEDYSDMDIHLRCSTVHEIKNLAGEGV